MVIIFNKTATLSKVDTIAPNLGSDVGILAERHRDVGEVAPGERAPRQPAGSLARRSVLLNKCDPTAAGEVWNERSVASFQSSMTWRASAVLN